MPWGNPGDHRDFEPQRHDDGYIEVIGFTMASLVSTLQVLPDLGNAVGSTAESKVVLIPGEPPGFHILS